MYFRGYGTSHLLSGRHIFRLSQVHINFDDYSWLSFDEFLLCRYQSEHPRIGSQF
jgi:hypothetical protein